jgi:hypothetical protein
VKEPQRLKGLLSQALLTVPPRSPTDSIRKAEARRSFFGYMVTSENEEWVVVELPPEIRSQRPLPGTCSVWLMVKLVP